jgi:Flp pilus assembly protein CpaB
VRFRKSSAPILAAGLTLLLVVASGYAAAATPATFHAERYAPAAPQGKVVVARGMATTSDGSAVPDAAVYLYAWPSDSVLQKLTSGQKVPRTLVATATANSAGMFSLSLPPARWRPTRCPPDS